MPNQNPWANRGANLSQTPAPTNQDVPNRFSNFRGAFTQTHFPPVESEALAERNPLVPPNDPNLAIRDAQRLAFVNGFVTASESNLSDARKILSDEAYEDIVDLIRGAAEEIAKGNYK